MIINPAAQKTVNKSFFCYVIFKKQPSRSDIPLVEHNQLAINDIDIYICQQIHNHGKHFLNDGFTGLFTK